MKILIAPPYFYPRVGGLENYALAIARGLRANGWEVVVVCGDTNVSKVTRETMEDYTVYRLPVWKVISNTPINPGWYKSLRQIIQAEQPDVINAHTPVPFMVDMVMLAAGRIPVVVTYHAATLFKPSGLVMKAATYAYGLVQAVTLGRARAIIAVSPYVKAHLSKRLQRKTEVVPNAVSPIRASQKIGHGLVFVANLEPTHAWKGLDLILDALAICVREYGVRPELTVIGDGGDRKRYEQRTRELRLTTSVTFAGQLVGEIRDRVAGRAAAQIIYPTTANDALPTVMLEGWAQGLPVIAGAIGPIPSLVEDNKTGILVAPNDPQALAQAIYELMANPAAIRTMGAAARRLVKAEYTWPKQIERTSKLLETLV
jgi:glycosyltransferase involved in cell wall biosynthesis